MRRPVMLGRGVITQTVDQFTLGTLKCLLKGLVVRGTGFKEGLCKQKARLLGGQPGQWRPWAESCRRSCRVQ